MMATLNEAEKVSAQHELWFRQLMLRVDGLEAHTRAIAKEEADKVRAPHVTAVKIGATAGGVFLGSIKTAACYETNTG